MAVGLGARDTLRTEMGYALHGHELSRTISPVQARLTWAVGWDKPTFWGREALLAQREAKQGQIARGLLALERGVPRADMRVVSSQKARIDSGQDGEGKDSEGKDGEREVGRTTSADGGCGLGWSTRRSSRLACAPTDWPTD